MITLEKDEKIIMKIRKHSLLVVWEVLMLSVLFFMPFILIRIISLLGIIQFQGNILYLTFALGGIWLLFLWISFFSFWTGLYFDVWIITNYRVIDIDQKRLFHREIATIRFSHIQDVVVEIKGILASFFDYGTIRVQSAGTQQEFVMHYVAKPYDAKDAILRLIHKDTERPWPVQMGK